MADSTRRHSLAPGTGLMDAAPGPTVSHSAPLFSGYYEGSPTISDTGALPTPSSPPQQQQQQQPAAQASSNHTLPLTANNSSYSFSFCGSDAFGVNDLLDNDPAPTPPRPQQQQQQQQQSFVPSLNTTVNSTTSNVSTFISGPPAGTLPATALNPVALSAANLEYFYGIPTPSAPPRTPYATSSASNCSSNHQQQQQQSYPHHHGSVSGDSNHTASSFSHPSMEAAGVGGTGVLYPPQQIPTMVPMPPQMVTAVGGLGATTTSGHSNSSSSNNNNYNNSTSSVGGGNGGGAGVQKDVLAFMAAEQQQQKFVLQQRNVYMSGLPVDFRPSAFRAMCEVFGRIESSKLCMEADDANRCRGFGFVLFYDVDSANSCIASLNGKVMQGKTLQVRRADLSAAPQPLNPVTQRNRTGSGLVTPPTLAPMNSTNSGSASQNQMGSSNNNSGTPGPAATYTLFSPHPPGLTQGNQHPNAVPSSVLMSTLPFTFATPTMMGPGAVSTANTNSSNTNSNNAALVGQKSSAAGSSFPYSGPSASSSLGNSNTPTMVYPATSTMVPAMRNGVPIMQVFAPCPPPGASNMMSPQQQQQQQATLMSHTSMSRSDIATTPHTTTTPSSAGSSNMNLGFAAVPQMVTQQQQQQQQMQMPFQPQPPMHPPLQPQRPMAQNTNVTFYSTVDAAGSPLMPAVMSGGGSGNHNNNNNSNNMSAHLGGTQFNNGGGVGLPSSNAHPATNGSMYNPNVLMQDYLTATGLDTNASNSNIYYYLPQ